MPTKTSDGERDYIQIMSADQISVNIVLVAEEIEVKDHRVEEKQDEDTVTVATDSEGNTVIYPTREGFGG